MVGPVEKITVCPVFLALLRRSEIPGRIVSEYAVFGRKPRRGEISMRLRRQRIVSIESVTEIESLNIVGDEPSPERVAGGRRELDRVRRELKDLSGVADMPGLELVFAASGTDLHLND